MQSAIRRRPASAATRLNPQSALRNMQNRFKRSNLELCGPKKDLKICPRSYRGVRSVASCVQIPNPTTRAGLAG
eukprot:434398-Alexandrium_andersonii.AAC.1